MIALTRDIDALRRADFPTIRTYVDTLMRSGAVRRRGGSFGGGSVDPAVESGRSCHVAVEDEPEPRGDQERGDADFAYVMAVDRGTALAAVTAG